MTTGERVQGGNPPLLEDDDLASYSTGLFNEEGYSYVKRRTGHSTGWPSRTIATTMCDKDALEPMAKWWGLPVRPRGGRVVTCIDGPAFRVEASGLRAELIVNRMMRFGLSHGKVAQWIKVVSQSAYERSRRLGSQSDMPSAEPRLIDSSAGSPLDENRASKLLENYGFLARYSTGLFNGGGCSWCWKSGERRYPRIEIAMCDKDALDPVGKWWRVDVSPRGGKAKVCANGPAYQIQASGSKAAPIMNEMVKYGLSHRKREQWRKVLSQCYRAAQTVPR